MSRAMTASATREKPIKTPLTREQIRGFWTVYLGWVLDGVDSVIFALVLIPAMTELLPNSGITATPANIAMYGSLLFGLFLIGWGLSFIWGPLADRFGRVKMLAASILVYSLFTGAAAFSENIWQLAAFRLIAGIGVGGEWALAGTYVAESWPEDRRKMGAGYLQTGYYVGFFLAALLNYTVGAAYGWRAMFLCGAFPVVVTIMILTRVKEPDKWKQAGAAVKQKPPLKAILSGTNLKRTLVMAGLLTVAIIGLWAGAVYEPSAVIQIEIKSGLTKAGAAKAASLATAILSIGTILGCLAIPHLAEGIGRKRTLLIYFLGMAVAIAVTFGWAFYRDQGLHLFIACLFVLCFFGGNFALFSLWLPEQFETRVRATAFAFCTSVGRFIGAGVNFALGAMVSRMGTLGTPVALTGLAFLVGLALIPLAKETKGEVLPQ